MPPILLALMLPVLLALWDRPISSWGFVEFAKLIILVAAVCAVVFIGCKAMGWTPPPWLIQICVVVAVAFVAILAISILASM